MAGVNTINLRWLWITITATLLIGGIWFGFYSKQSEKNSEMEACQKLNGSYIVVDKDYAMVGKVLTKVDVYGCVKNT